MSSQIAAFSRHDMTTPDEAMLFRQLLSRERLKETDLTRARRLHEEPPDGAAPMTQFRYRAVSAAGEVLQGQMEAASLDEVVNRLQDQGHTPLDARSPS